MKKSVKSILALLLVAAMALSLTGCGEIKKAESTVNETFAALKSLDLEKASAYLNVDELLDSVEEKNNDLTLEDRVLMEALFGKLEYEIVSSEKIDKNTVVVKTKITAVDMNSVLGEFIAKALQYAFANAFADPQPTEEETNKKMEEIFIECASKEDLATVTNEVDIKVVKADKGWKIETSEDFTDAVFGGLEKAADEISKVFGGAE